MRHGIFYLFFSVVVALDVLAHRYLYVRLFRDPGWPDAVRQAGLVLCVLLAVLMPAGIILSRSLPRAWAQPLAHASFAWMGTAFYLLLVLFAVDLARWVTEAVLHVGNLFAGGAGAPTEGTLPSPERRAVLQQATAGVAGVAALGLSGAALRSGLAEVEVRDVEVKLDKLPPELSGLNLVQLSDVHVGPTLGAGFMRSVVARTNDLRPDAVLITGDLVDGTVAQLRAHVAPLVNLKTRFGVYFVTGNHEYYSGAEEWEAELRRMGIRVLRNERVALGDQVSIDLGGVDDANANGMARGHGADVSRIIAGRDPERALVLMAHQPKQIDLATQAGADLQLSGHTHGGQLWPFSAMVKLAQPYVAGLYQHDPATQIYVSRGTGYWGPPMRLMAPAEITRIVLT